MKILVNGTWRDVGAAQLAAALQELGYGTVTAIATAVNGDFVPHSARTETYLHEGDRLEVIAPMQGG